MPQKKLLSVDDLLTRSWEIYKQNFKTLVGIQVISIVATMAFLLFCVAIVGVQAAISDILNNTLSMIVVGIIFMGLIIGVVVIQVWSQVALILSAGEKQRTIKEAATKARGNLAMFFWTNLIAGLIVLAGTILLVIPGIILAIFLSFTPYIIVNEKVTGLAALRKSKNYIAGRAFKIFWRLFAMGTLYVICLIVISLALQAFDSEGLQTLISYAISIFASPFMVVYYNTLYENAKETA